jgi:hypothetical protein
MKKEHIQVMNNNYFYDISIVRVGERILSLVPRKTMWWCFEALLTSDFSFHFIKG